jgi:hypothetical protein
MQMASATFTDSSSVAGSTVTAAVINTFGTPTITAANAGVGTEITYTTIASTRFANVPSLGANTLATNKWNCWWQSGDNRMDGALFLGTSGNLIGNNATTGDATHDLLVTSATGSKILIGSTDTTVTGGDTIGQIDWYAKDTSTTTNLTPASIIVKSAAAGAIATDINPTKMEFYTTGTGVGATPTLALTLNADQTATFAANVYAPNLDFLGARAYLNATLGTTVSVTETKINLDAESYDVGADFASYKYVAPVAGYYRLDGQIEFDGLAADKVGAVMIRVNNATVARAYTPNGGYAGCTARTGITIHLAAADYVELFYFHNGATTVDIYGGAISTFLECTLVKAD